MNITSQLNELHGILNNRWGLFAAGVIGLALFVRIIRFLSGLANKNQTNEFDHSNYCTQERREEVLYFQRKALMTANEREFFGRLMRALPDYHVFPQVAFNALLDAPRGLYWRDRFRVRNHFDRKIADYVVCKRDTFEVMAVVELDDKTHDAEKDEKRNAMLRSANYRVLRFQSRSKPSEAEITALFK